MRTDCYRLHLAKMMYLREIKLMGILAPLLRAMNTWNDTFCYEDCPFILCTRAKKVPSVQKVRVKLLRSKRREIDQVQYVGCVERITSPCAKKCRR